MRFSLHGVNIELTFWFFAVLAAFAVFLRDIRPGYIIVPVVIHELGHLTALAINRVKIEAVRFSAFGINIKKKQTPALTLGKELIVLFAGAFANLAVAGVCLFASEALNTMLFISANLAVAIFNLLPIGNLDGGGIARKISEYYLKPRAAFVISRAFSFLTLTPLFAAAIFLIISPQRNFTLLLICIYLLADVITET